MNTDFRLSVGLTSNPKTIKLMRRCGDRAFFCLINLWGWVSQYKPEGDLSGMDDESIEISAGWTGGEGEFVAQLSAVGFLDGEPGGYSLHEWEEHNPWVAGAIVRKEAASKAGKASAAKRGVNSTGVQRNSTERSTDVQRESNGNQRPVENPFNGNPTPSPLPSPKDKKRVAKTKFSPPTLEEVAEYCRERENGIDPQHFVDRNTATGWMYGQTKMVDWRAVIRTWERNGGRHPPAKPSLPGQSSFEQKNYGESGLL